MWSARCRKERQKCQDIFINNFVFTKDLNHGFETRSFPNSLAATLRGFTFCVAAPSSSTETRSFPNSLAATLRGFTFYLAVPISSIRG